MTRSDHFEQVTSPRNALGIIVKGVAMGLADSVPGVSGGTIAVIAGIYERLINAIKSVDAIAVKLLFRGEVAAAWSHVQGNFLSLLALGILLGLLMSANTVLYLLEYQFGLLMGFFMGLVLASCVFLQSEFSLKSGLHLLFLLLGAGVTLILSSLAPQIAEGDNLLYLFFCGAIGICAMVLPGISGAFLLLVLGVYQTVLEALLGFNVTVIFVFVMGCAVGLLSFSRFLAWVMGHYRAASYAFLTGMLLASLKVLWPWQRAISFYEDRHGVQQVLQTKNLSPFHYMEQTGQEPQLLLTVAAMVLGAGMIIALNKFFSRDARLEQSS